MGWFGDAFKVIFGFDEGLRAWRDRVAAAEQHLGWGMDSHEVRDFERVLEILDQCPANEQPSAHDRYRCERAATEAHLWLARLALERLAGQIEKMIEYFEGIEEGRRSLTAQVEAARQRVKGLEADGSLISAREERRRLEDMERETQDLPDLSAEKRERRAAIFGKHAPVFELHRDKAALRLAALKAVTGLAAEDLASRDEAARKQDAGLAALEVDWKALSVMAPAPAAQARPPQGAPGAATARPGAAAGRGGGEDRPEARPR